MTLTDDGVDESTGVHKVSASIVYSNSPGQNNQYSGTYDETTNQLILKNRNTQMADPGLNITITPGDPLTFSTHVSYDSSMADYNYTLNGTKQK